MLAIVSDLHLQHTGCDAMRYRLDGAVREIGVRRNVPKGAIDRLFATIDEIAERRESAEVHLVFAGDIFELHRTPLWFLDGDVSIRPTREARPHIGAKRLRSRVEAILEALEQENAAVWQAIQEHVARRKKPKVTVHYVPGNHDRLVNAWPEVRQRVRSLLGMGGADTSPFPNVLDFTANGISDYRTRVRHGQEYDPSNFVHSSKKVTALDKSWQEYLRPAFGDYVTVDVATRLALAFRARYAAESRGWPHTPTRARRAAYLRDLYLDLTEFDDVRPSSLLVDYLVKRVGVTRRQTFKDLKPILRDVVETAVQDRFFMEHARKHLPKPLIKALSGLLKQLEPSFVESIIRLFTGKGSERKDPPAHRALREFSHASNGPFEIVVGGHTHYPEQVPLHPPKQPSECYYLNSGTWRTTIPAGPEGFGRLRAYTLVFAFNERERAAKTADGRRFETWTGHLSAGEIGPYDEAVDTTTLPAPTRRIRFQSLEVKSIQREWGGAELSARFGVDDQPLALVRRKVRSGQVLLIDESPLPLDPALDGEIWFHGKELDLGEAGLNPHDLLPWALRRLPREPSSEQFETGSGQLTIRGLNDTHFLLHYTIEPIV